MSSRRRKMSDAESSEEEREVLTDDDDVAEGDPLLCKEGALGSPAKATGTTEVAEGENSRGSGVDEEGYEEPEESDGPYNSDGEETASVLSTVTAEGDGIDGLQGNEGSDDEDEVTSATDAGTRQGEAAADIATTGSEDAYGFGSEDDREGGDGDALTVGEAGDLDTGGGWGGADVVGGGGEEEGEVNRGSVEDEEAQRAAFAAAKAEEEAIKEERRAMRKNPAIIPTLGGFFVHDNRVGDGDAAGSDHQGSGGEEAEDDLVGKWRADALPPARGDAEGEERGTSGKKKISKKKATGWGRGDEDGDDDDEPWGHEGYEEVLRAEEEGRPISNSSAFWSNPTGKAGKDRAGAWKRGGSGRRGGGSGVWGAEQESFQDDLASAGNQSGSWSRSQRDGFEGTGRERERGRGRGRGGSRGRDRDRGSRGRGGGGSGGSWREGHAAPLGSANPSETWPELERATGAGEGVSTAATTQGPSTTGETTHGGSRIESGVGAGWGKSNPSGWGQPGPANGEGETWGMSSNLEDEQGQRVSGSYAEGPNDWDDSTAGKQSKGNNPSIQDQRRKPGWVSPEAPDTFEANGGDVAGRVASRGGRGNRRQSPHRPRGAPPVHRKGRGTPASRERRGGDGGGGQGSSSGGRKDRNQTAKPPASLRAPTVACGDGTGWGEPNPARTVDEKVGGWGATKEVAGSGLQATATSTASTRSNPEQTAAASPPGSTPSALTADAKQWTGASRSREGDASAAASASTLTSSVALLPALSDTASATVTTTAAGIAAGAHVAFGEETAGYVQGAIPMNVTAAAAAEAGAGPAGAAIVAPGVEFGVGVNGSVAVPLHLQIPSFVPPPGGGGGVGGSLGSSGFVEGAGIETLMPPLSHLPPDQHAMLLHAHHQHLVAQIQMQRAQIYEMQQHAQRVQKQEELVRRQRVQNQLALDYAGVHSLDVQQHLQHQLGKRDADEREEEWRRRQGKETHGGSQPEDTLSRQQNQHQQQQQQDTREDDVARERLRNDARSSSSSSHKQFDGSSSIHSNVTANGKSGGAAAGPRGYGPGAPRPAAPPSTLLVPISGASSRPSVTRLESPETRGDSSPQLLVGQSMPLPQVVPGASAVGGGGDSGASVPVAGNGLMAVQMGMQGAGVAMGIGVPGDLQQLQDMHIQELPWRAIAAAAAKRRAYGINGSPRASSISRETFAMSAKMKQGLYNHAAAAAAAGYFVTPGGQSLPVHLLAEMSGGGGSWYPEQHSSPVPVAWGAGDGVVAGHGSGAVLSEDVVLPPQSDSWMRAAVQQELLREQQQQQLHDQAVAHQYQQQQQQQQYAAAVSTAAASGTAAAPGGAGLGFGGVAPPGLDMSQQPLLNAQAMSFQPPVAGSADPSQSGGAGDAYYTAQTRQQQQQLQYQHRNQR